jgi:uncharacterized protein YecT (DUF1311 family)
MNIAIVAATLFCVSLVGPEIEASPQGTLTPVQVASMRSVLIKEAAGALGAERDHAKQPYCQNPHYSQTELNECAARELRISLTHYQTYSDTITQLLELQVADDASIDPTPYREAALTFGKAESSWKDYYVQTCHAVASQNEGGSVQPFTDLTCREDLVQRHMEELATSFSFLWDPSER